MKQGGVAARPSSRSRVRDDELARGLGHYLAGSPEGVTLLGRRAIPYRSTYPLEELHVRLADGAEQRLVFKDLSHDGQADPAGGVKAAFLRDPLREIETYRDVLGPHGLSAPGFRGAVTEPGRNLYWLFLERVDGDLLWQLGEDEIWQGAACWLADMHAHFFGRSGHLPERLLRHDDEYFRRWLQRARRFARRPERSPGRGREFGRLAARTLQALEWLAEQPVTFLHGEFYPANVMVEPAPCGIRIRPLDWEMAGVGPGLLDLAALTSGVWSDGDREMLMEAYRAALPAELRPSYQELREGLVRCRLLLAVQWLGWSDGWTPPPEHSQDWLATALELAAEVGA